jgi:hypothetical protein
MTHAVACTKELNSEGFCFLFNQDVVSCMVPQNGSSLTAAVYSTASLPRITLLGWAAGSASALPSTPNRTDNPSAITESPRMCYGVFSTNQAEWDTYLPMVEFAMNNAYSEVTRATPFLLNYGVHPRHPYHREIGKKKLQCNGVTLSNPGQRHTAQHARAAVAHTLRTIPEVPESIKFTKAMHRAIKHTKLLLHATRQRMINHVNKHRSTETPYKVGDRVWLATKYIKLQHEGCNKLMPRYCGPFKIIKQINPVALRLELPKVMKVHPMFSMSPC